ncbi:MAG: hypothetical protein ACI38Q_08835 [Candidatus Bruticola sp.]
MKYYYYSAVIAALWAVATVCLPSFAADEGTAVSPTSKSHTGVDSVSISKVTPRTSADVPQNCQLPVVLLADYQLQSSSSGLIKTRAFIWSPKDKSGSGYKKGLRPISAVMQAAVKKGSGSVKVAFPPLAMPVKADPQTQLVIVSSLQNSAQKEVAWGSTYNFVRGSMMLAKTADKSPRSAITVLDFSPKVGTLTVGKTQEFTYKFQYSLKDQDYGFVNFELKNAMDSFETSPWYCAAVPVPKGAGVVKYVSSKYFFPYMYKFYKMRLGVLYRTEPLGGTVDALFYGDWQLASN